MAYDGGKGVIRMYHTTSVEGCAKCEGHTTVVLTHNGGITDGYRQCSWCGYFEEFDQYFSVWHSGYRR